MGSRGRKLTPELEHDLVRDARLGYEPADPSTFIRCIEHGSPTPLERWHCHDEYELQLIVGARGRAFVGDYVGNFEPGHLVLTGPRLPHNWISTDLPLDGLAVRSLVLQFRDQPLRDGMRLIPDLAEATPLLEQARHGVEFFGLSDRVRSRFLRIKHSQGLARLTEFVSLMDDLRRCRDMRLLSSTQALEPSDSSPTIGSIIDYLHERHAEPLPIGEVAAHFHMGESRFARTFGKAVDCSFTTFVNRVRVHKACERLMHSTEPVSSICYAVGFNNVANFNRRFKEVRGLTPSEFRRLSLERLGRGLSPPAGPAGPARRS